MEKNNIITVTCLAVFFMGMLASSVTTSYAVTDFSIGSDAGKQKGIQDKQNNDKSFNVDEYVKPGSQGQDSQCQQEGHSFGYCQGFMTGYHLGFGGIDSLFR